MTGMWGVVRRGSANDGSELGQVIRSSDGGLTWSPVCSGSMWECLHIAKLLREDAEARARPAGEG